MMTSAQVVETSVSDVTNSPSQDYTQLDDHTSSHDNILLDGIILVDKVPAYTLYSPLRKNIIIDREAIMADEEIDQLINKILNYEVGAYERFDDALPGEMEGFRLNIMFFGMTGSGKSALINNIFKSLGLSQPVVTQITGKEGTIILECCDLADGVTFYDSRGSLHLDEMEKGTFFFFVLF